MNRQKKKIFRGEEDRISLEDFLLEQVLYMNIEEDYASVLKY